MDATGPFPSQRQIHIDLIRLRDWLQEHEELYAAQERLHYPSPRPKFRAQPGADRAAPVRRGCCSVADPEARRRPGPGSQRRPGEPRARTRLQGTVVIGRETVRHSQGSTTSRQRQFVTRKVSRLARVLSSAKRIDAVGGPTPATDPQKRRALPITPWQGQYNQYRGPIPQTGRAYGWQRRSGRRVAAWGRRPQAMTLPVNA